MKKNFFFEGKKLNQVKEVIILMCVCVLHLHIIQKYDI